MCFIVVKKLTLDILKLKMKSKKNVLGVFLLLFVSNLIEGAMDILISLKGAICKKV